MRLRQQKYGYRAEGLLTKIKPLPEQPKFHSKKDTKKWCKGVVGREHDYEYQFPHGDSWEWRLVPICVNCGKQDYRDTLFWCKTHEEWEEHPYFGDMHR